MRTVLLLPLLLGCQYLEEIREDPAAVSWSGYVLYYPEGATDYDTLSAGTLTLVDLDDAVLAEGSQPYEDTPGYWLFEEVPVATEIGIRVAAEGATTVLWRSRSPSGSGTWLTGAVLTWEESIYAALFDSLDGQNGLRISPLSEGQVAHLWGEPLVPQDWAGAEISVTDGAGDDAAVIALAYDEDGALVDAGEGAVDAFVAVNLAPGTVTLSVTSAAGVTTETLYPARGGDLLSAIYYDLATD